MSISGEVLHKAYEVVKRSFPDQPLFDLTELGDGNINGSFLVVFAQGQEEKLVLQRLNRRVFPRPDLVMANLRVISDHLNRKLRCAPNNELVNWQVIRPIPNALGKDYFIDSDDNFWRFLNFVDGTETFSRISGGRLAGETGKALGIFHQLLWDLNPEILADTLPDFHSTPVYLADYDRILQQPIRLIVDNDEEHCAKVIERRRGLASVLEDAAQNGLISLRIIHGDPKLTNILFDKKTGRARCLIDLDTVTPGLLHYDIGDCLRSCCNLSGEDNENLAQVNFDADICRNLLGGYLAEMGPLLTEADYDFIYPALRLMAFELGLRFFSDHLAGDVYFKVKHRGHNLQRALAQFRLLAGIEKSESLIRDIIDNLRLSMARSFFLR